MDYQDSDSKELYADSRSAHLNLQDNLISSRIRQKSRESFLILKRTFKNFNNS